MWIKPPGESDGDYPSGSHTHGDPRCDPNGTNTDGNGKIYPTSSIPGYDIPAGQWFPAEFQMLVQNAFPAVPWPSRTGELARHKRGPCAAAPRPWHTGHTHVDPPASTGPAPTSRAG